MFCVISIYNNPEYLWNQDRAMEYVVECKHPNIKFKHSSTISHHPQTSHSHQSGLARLPTSHHHHNNNDNNNNHHRHLHHLTSLRLENTHKNLQQTSNSPYNLKSLYTFASPINSTFSLLSDACCKLLFSPRLLILRIIFDNKPPQSIKCALQ